MIEYGVQPHDGGRTGLYAARKFAELHAPRVPGDVVYRIDRGPWLPLPARDLTVAHSDGVTVLRAPEPTETGDTK